MAVLPGDFATLPNLDFGSVVPALGSNGLFARSSLRSSYPSEPRLAQQSSSQLDSLRFAISWVASPPPSPPSAVTAEPIRVLIPIAMGQPLGIGIGTDDEGDAVSQTC